MGATGRKRTPPLPSGTRRGQRIVVTFIGWEQRGIGHGASKRYLVRCDCGRESKCWHNDFLRGLSCGYCARDQGLSRGGANKPKAGRYAHYLARAERPGVMRALIEAGEAWPQLWQQDSDISMEACAELAVQLGGMGLQEIAVLFGFSREHIRQIEHRALRKLAHNRKLREYANTVRSETTWDAIERHAFDWEAA